MELVSLLETMIVLPVEIYTDHIFSFLYQDSPLTMQSILSVCHLFNSLPLAAEWKKFISYAPPGHQNSSLSRQRRIASNEKLKYAARIGHVQLFKICRKVLLEEDEFVPEIIVMIAVKHNQLKILRRLAFEELCNVDDTSAIIRTGHFEIIKFFNYEGLLDENYEARIVLESGDMATFLHFYHPEDYEKNDDYLLTAIKLGHAVIVYWLLHNSRVDLNLKHLFASCKAGNLELVKYFISKGIEHTPAALLVAALAREQFELADWLLATYPLDKETFLERYDFSLNSIKFCQERGFLLTNATVDNALASGQYILASYLLSEGRKPSEEPSVETITKSFCIPLMKHFPDLVDADTCLRQIMLKTPPDTLELIKYLRSLVPSVAFYDGMLDKCIFTDYSDHALVRYCLLNGYPVFRELFYYCLDVEDMKLVKLCIRHGVELDSQALLIATRKENIELIRYLRNCGCPWDVQCFDEALTANNPEIINLVLQLGCPADFKAAKLCIKMQRTSLFLEIVKKFDIASTSELLLDALKSDNEEIIRFLLAAGVSLSMKQIRKKKNRLYYVCEKFGLLDRRLPVEQILAAKEGARKYK